MRESHRAPGIVEDGGIDMRANGGGRTDDERSAWVVVLTSYDRDGHPLPGDPEKRFDAWLRSYGIDWNPFRVGEMRIESYRIALPGGRAGCNRVYRVRADALQRLGIEPPAESAR